MKVLSILMLFVIAGLICYIRLLPTSPAYQNQNTFMVVAGIDTLVIDHGNIDLTKVRTGTMGNLHSKDTAIITLLGHSGDKLEARGSRSGGFSSLDSSELVIDTTVLYYDSVYVVGN